MTTFRAGGWKRALLVVVGMGLLAAVGVSILVGSRGWVHLQCLRREESELESQAARMESRNNRMAAHLEKLRTDDAYLEKVVRERLGWVKPGEIVYRVGGMWAAAPGVGEHGD